MKQLSIRKNDPERFLGFQGKFTTPSKGLSLLLAVAFTFCFYLVVRFVPESIHQETWLGVVTRRGLIPYFTLGGFVWGLSLMWFKSLKVRGQTKALRFLLNAKLDKQIFHADNAAEWLKWLDTNVDQPQAFILINRLRTALASLASLKDPAALPALVSSHTEADEVQVEESYHFSTTLLFVIPVLGFIGTVLGLSQAIGGFGIAMQELDGNMDAMVSSLQGVTGGLSIAFDTTLFALVCALTLQVYVALVRGRETRFMEDCNTYFQNAFFPNLSVERPKSEDTSTE